MYNSDNDHHVHFYLTRTSCVNGHIHCLSGLTGPTMPWGASHVHYFNGVTTCDHSHVHYYKGCTGPSIPCPSGGHIHCIKGCTTVDDCHSHYYETLTGNKQTSMLFNRYAY